VSDLITLHQLAVRLRLPREWLRAEALAGRLPCLRVRRKLLFSLPTVERILAERAAVGQEAHRA
jgi:hypothetical protein